MFIIVVTVIHNCNLGEKDKRKWGGEEGEGQTVGARLIFNVDSNYSLYCQYYDTLVYSSRRGCQQGFLQRIIASRVSRVYRCRITFKRLHFLKGLGIVFSKIGVYSFIYEMPCHFRIIFQKNRRKISFPKLNPN